MGLDSYKGQEVQEVFRDGSTKSFQSRLLSIRCAFLAEFLKDSEG